MGKSTGAGGLAVWMHHLTDREWISSYSASGSIYKGPAVKVYAGVTGDDLQQDAEARSQVVVSGQCPVSATSWWLGIRESNRQQDRGLCWRICTRRWTFCSELYVWNGCRSGPRIWGDHDEWKICASISLREPRSILGIEWWSTLITFTRDRKLLTGRT